MINSEQEAKIFGKSFNKNSKTTTFIICSFIIFTCFGVSSIIQEKLFLEKGFNFAWTLTFFQFFIFSFLAKVDLKVSFHQPRRAPINEYIMLAVYVIGSMGLSNWACVYLDFPVQVILKSSKIIFVMIAGKFIQNVRYSWVQYSAAILMIFGIVVFTVENIAISPRFNYAGILIMMFALIGDSFMGNNQERVMKKYRPTQSEMVHYIYLIASMIILALILISGEFFHFFDYALKNKTIFLMIVPFGAVGYVGSATVLILIELFGVHIAVTTTTLRKFFTILTSFFIFSKPFTWKYLIGVFLVFSGIGLNIWYKKRQEMLKESMVSFTNSNNGKMNV